MNHFFTLLLAASCLTAVGQCDIDFDFGDADFGISPNHLAGEPFECGFVGSPYEDIIQRL